MIVVDDLTVQLGGARALDELSAVLDAPVHGVIGPNGAGKTTLLNVLSGFVAARTGTIAVAGEAIERLGARERARSSLGRTFQTERLAATLHGFERKRVEIARALVGRPRVLLLDEPAGGLSPPESEQLERLLGAVGGEYGAQVILVDHDVDLIARVCERVLVLDFGARLADGPTRAVLDDPAVRAAWLGTAEVAA